MNDLREILAELKAKVIELQEENLDLKAQLKAEEKTIENKKWQGKMVG